MKIQYTTNGTNKVTFSGSFDECLELLHLDRNKVRGLLNKDEVITEYIAQIRLHKCDIFNAKEFIADLESHGGCEELITKYAKVMSMSYSTIECLKMDIVMINDVWEKFNKV